MRLNEFETLTILDTFKEVFGKGDIYLFGSRVDNAQRGGDIDLYLKLVDPTNLFEKKIQFLSKIHEKLGDQKIDIVFNSDENRLIEKEATTKGVQLNTDAIKIKKYFHECDKHILRIEYAYQKISPFLPISASAYPLLNDEQIEAIDQYLFRFAKLQDTMGDKLFKLILSHYEENIQPLTFIDILNKLEKLEFLPSAKEWLILRKIRNEISHQYDDEPEGMSQAINHILGQKGIIVGIYAHFWNRYEGL
ncbi:MAG: nucleotidyltransferase domain-containing protein [Sulfuricurvum sp.]